MSNAIFEDRGFPDTRREELSARRARLSEAKLRILAGRLEGKLSPREDAAPADPPGRESADEPSLLQEFALWHDRWAREQSVPVKRRQYYRLLQVTGPLDVGCLERSFQEVHRRHDILNSTFPFADGKFVRAARPGKTFALPSLDLCHLPEGEREAAARSLCLAEILKDYDPAGDDLLRALLLKIDDKRHLLLFVMQHLAFDGKSQDLLIHEISQNYMALATKSPSPLPPLRAGYQDFARWQRARAERGRGSQRLLSYWKGQFGGESVPDAAALELPFTLPQTRPASYRTGVEALRVSGSLYASLTELARRADVTMFVLLLAVINTLLYRYTGRGSIYVCTSASGRGREEFADLIGKFSSCLWFRTQLAGGLSFLELLRRTRESTLSAFDHQDLPYPALLESLRPASARPPQISTAPMVWFNFTPRAKAEARPEPSSGGPPVRFRRVSIDGADLEQSLGLSISATEKANGLGVNIRYERDLYDPRDMARMAEHFHALLETVSERPHQRLSEMRLLTAAEERLLSEWNRAESHAAAESRCLHELFESQAERTPEAPALISGTGQLTYRELNERSSRLARRLRQRGVGPERVVGLRLGSSADVAVAALAVWKAGGACALFEAVPSGQWLAAAFESGELALLLDGEGLTDESDSRPGRALPPGGEHGSVSPESADHAAQTAAPWNRAVVSYRPDARGRVRAAAVTHEAVWSRLRGLQKRILLNGADRFLLQPATDHEALVSNLLWPLSRGAGFVFDDDEHALARHAVTVWRTTPPLLEDWLSGRGRGDGAALRRVICSVERLSPALKARALALPGVEFSSLYRAGEGVGEVAVYSPTREQAESTASIGRPLVDFKLHLLDAQLRPVPVGLPGELHVGGLAVSQTRTDSARAAAQKFIPDPFGERPGARLLATGDVARYLPDGSLELLGRKSEFVRRRGFVFHLGRVEKALESHPLVRRAVVLFKDDPRGPEQLVACLTCVGEGVTAAELDDSLRRRQPGYVLPTAYIFFDKFPLTNEGGIDREALLRLQAVEVSAAPSWLEWA
ncbi:MAG TPA: condensation domain-containing protein [Pyrinomonadaceae bacterium]|nr:condensation domain-containing protein [Pyrinomonadaceae bacterium]